MRSTVLLDASLRSPLADRPGSRVNRLRPLGMLPGKSPSSAIRPKCISLSGSLPTNLHLSGLVGKLPGRPLPLGAPTPRRRPGSARSSLPHTPLEERSWELQQQLQQRWAHPTAPPPAQPHPQDVRELFSVCSIKPNKGPVKNVRADQDEEGRSERPLANEEENVVKMPPSASGYDVDTEHAYIMAKALRSYREHYFNDPAQPAPADKRGRVRRSSNPKRSRASARSSGSGESTGGSDRGSSTPASPATTELSLQPQLQPMHVHLPNPTDLGLGTLSLAAAPRAPRGRRERPRTAPAPRRHYHPPHPAPIRVPGAISMETLREMGHLPGGHIDVAHINLGQAYQSHPHPDNDRQSRSKSKVLLAKEVQLPMDKIGNKEDDGRRRFKSEGTFFSATKSPRKQYFTIHPEWVSENLTVSRMSLRERTGTYPPRRCKSAPPPCTRSRNPITWENPDTPDYRQSRSKSRGLQATKSPRKQYFTIHPEWASEKPREKTATYIPRRSKSAPPPITRTRTRNPITWENHDTASKR